MLRAILLLLVGCGRVGFDAGADGATSADRDGDGIADALDNCPDLANVDQANEDGDRFGDACDPCPPFADADPIADQPTSSRRRCRSTRPTRPCRRPTPTGRR